MSKTVRIRNVSPLGDLDVPGLRKVVKYHEVVEVDSATAKAYLAHPTNWAEVGASKSDTKSDD